ncbi:DNA-binding response regulator, OmpR family, contains REC and winged-helix (wHTH) domain [Dyella sp. OK004]|uniref:response regulator transcription factor n=1 Tax=Dyella sp. OK004 TaxID=1855292 RepID=UPI0008F1DAD1|nr:response regulator transcription factor [Dyella sp. OK004]SFS19214.1 DNA-binding response regulator, OmpR family, contains REC and winged-helix (wHTH) domain [Dyella sp. OK004]
MSRILVVEDDAQTAAEIVDALLDHGFSVEHAEDGRQGLVKAVAGGFDAVVLDRMLPGTPDGLGVLATLRATGAQMPVLILSALSALDERVRGLRAGGDDYLTKPFEAIELTARLDALLRRRHVPAQETTLRAGSLEIDLLTRAVRRDGETISLLPREYNLLAFLMHHAGQVVTRTMLFEEVWGYRSEERTNVIDVHISKLRQKIDVEGRPSLIQTMRGSGYILHATD